MKLLAEHSEYMESICSLNITLRLNSESTLKSEISSILNQENPNLSRFPLTMDLGMKSTHLVMSTNSFQINLKETSSSTLTMTKKY